MKNFYVLYKSENRLVRAGLTGFALYQKTALDCFNLLDA